METNEPTLPKAQVEILNRIRSTDMEIRVVLMRKKFRIEHLASLSPGSVLTFQMPVTTPASVEVNGKAFANGEVVQVDDRFGVRVSEIVG